MLCLKCHANISRASRCDSNLCAIFSTVSYELTTCTESYVGQQTIDAAIKNVHNVTSLESVSVAQLVNATVHATGTGGQTTLRFSSGNVWFAY